MAMGQKWSAAFPSISRKVTVNHCFILPSKSIWDSLWALMYQMKGVKWSSNFGNMGNAKRKREGGIIVIQKIKQKKSLPYAKTTRKDCNHYCL